MSLEAIIKDQIRTHGPMSIAEYMTLALSHPEHGYYMRKDPLGAQGDFITAPEISQVFGELIGLWMAEQWRLQGKPQAILVELGPGRGTLMSDLLRATKLVQGFHNAISIHMIETSPVLRQKQWQLLAKQHPRIEWHDTIEASPDTPLFLVANEFFDALPIRQFIGDEERMVGMDVDGNLEFVMPAKAGIHVDPGLRRGDEIKEICEPANDIARAIAAHIASHGGAALFIDYGYEQGQGDTLQALKQHAFHPPLQNPGEADLTAHVNFGALKHAAQVAGAAVHGPQPQGAFLGMLGAVERGLRLCEGAPDSTQATIMSGIARLLSPELMGELFKAMCIVPTNHPKPEGF